MLCQELNQPQIMVSYAVEEPVQRLPRYWGDNLANMFSLLNIVVYGDVMLMTSAET